MKALKIGFAAFVLCALALLGACGGNDQLGNTLTTSTTQTTATTEDTMLDAQDGSISDVSDDTDNGLVGDIVTDVSEIVTDIITTTER